MWAKTLPYPCPTTPLRFGYKCPPFLRHQHLMVLIRPTPALACGASVAAGRFGFSCARNGRWRREAASTSASARGRTGASKARAFDMALFDWMSKSAQVACDFEFS